MGVPVYLESSEDPPKDLPGPEPEEPCDGDDEPESKSRPMDSKGHEMGLPEASPHIISEDFVFVTLTFALTLGARLVAPLASSFSQTSRCWRMRRIISSRSAFSGSWERISAARR